MQKIIALDADGVLLDYGIAYGRAWARYSGSDPVERDPQAYWPMERWAVPRLSGRELKDFCRQFDQDFWSSIPAMPGALQACQLLVENGHELVCVTALDDQFGQARQRNLQSLGFPITRVITTIMEAVHGSPKAPAVLRTLQLVAFVDDFGPYFDGVDATVHRALGIRDPNGSPNTNKILARVDSSHQYLLGFARWWIRC